MPTASNVDIWRKLRRRLALVYANSINTLLVPVFNLAVSLSVIRLASLELWGGFVNFLIWMTLAIHIAAWGNKEYLLRAYSRRPGEVAGLWAENLRQRLPLLGLLLLLILIWPLSASQKLILMLWGTAGFIYQSLEALVVYRRRFLAAFFIEMLAAGGMLAAIWQFRLNLSLDMLLLIFSGGLFLKALLGIRIFHSDMRLPKFGSLDWGYFAGALPFFLLGFTGMLQSRTDLYCLTLFLGETQAGTYQVFINLLIYIQVGASMILQPFLKNVYRLPLSSLRRLARRLFFSGFIICAPALGVIYFLLKILFQIDIGPVMLGWAAAFCLPIFYYLPVIYQLYRADRQSRVLYINIWGIAVNLLLNIVLLPRWGMTGAIAASAVSQWLMLLPYYLYFRKECLTDSDDKNPPPMQDDEPTWQLGCPICGADFDMAAGKCDNEHQFTETDGVLRFMNAAFSEKIATFECALEKYRSAEVVPRISDPAAFKQLPFGAATGNDPEWRRRQIDLTLIRELLPAGKPQRILEIGAWNGWLSNRLAADGHCLLSIDYFGDRFDGLGAVQYYRNSWTCLQMDISDLAPLQDHFDVIILNRCLQFLGNPSEYLRSLQAMVRPGGKIIATGLQFFVNHHQKSQQVANAEQAFQEAYQLPLFLAPTRGYLSAEDRRALRAGGMVLYGYRPLRLQNLRARLQPSRPLNEYGLWQKAEGRRQKAVSGKKIFQVPGTRLLVAGTGLQRFRSMRSISLYEY